MKVFGKKKSLITLLLCSVMMITVYAQDAMYLSDIIEAETIDWEQAAFLILIGGELVPVGTSPRLAWDHLLATHWFDNVPQRDSKITVAEYCGLATKTFNYKGGLFYTLFKSDRYAFRDLAYKTIVPSYLDPRAKFSGLEALKILEALLDEVARKEAIEAKKEAKAKAKVEANEADEAEVTE